MNVTIDKEFRTLITPHTEEEFAGLEALCLKYGIQDSLKTWNGILIDGHNRYEIAEKHGLEFKTEEGMAKAIATCKKYDIDAIVAIGGDGTFRGATDLSLRGIPAIGVTGTIDNDITATDYTVGYDTAMNTVLSLIDDLRDTCESHSRCNVVEVMGRGAGDIALNTAIALGASAVVRALLTSHIRSAFAVYRKINLNHAQAFEISGHSAVKIRHCYSPLSAVLLYPAVQSSQRIIPSMS